MVENRQLNVYRRITNNTCKYSFLQKAYLISQNPFRVGCIQTRTQKRKNSNFTVVKSGRNSLNQMIQSNISGDVILVSCVPVTRALFTKTHNVGLIMTRTQDKHRQRDSPK